jgi:hypothetical protein
MGRKSNHLMERVYAHLSKNGCRKSGFLANPYLTGKVLLAETCATHRHALKITMKEITDVFNRITVETQKDVFRGVTHNKSARYFLSGIDKETTYDGIKNYLKNKGIHETHLALFKPRGRFASRTAKINIPPFYARSVESRGFWPEGIWCRPWYSE